MNDEAYDHLVKILMIGDSGVGKTCILQRIIKGEFLVNHLTTIAIDFKLKIMDISGTKLKMQLWDTAGQERFNTLTQGFFKGILQSIYYYTNSFISKFGSKNGLGFYIE